MGIKYRYIIKEYSNGRPNIMLDIDDVGGYQVTQDVPEIQLKSNEYVMTKVETREDYLMLKSTGLLDTCVKKVVTSDRKCYDVGRFTSRFVEVLNRLGYN